MLKMTKENSASTMATALAASTCPSLNFEKMYSGAVCVRSARLPETRIVEPNSPTARESKQRARHNRAAQGRQRDIPKSLPARRANRRGSFFERTAHRIVNGFDDAERERKRHEDVSENNRPRREHHLYALRR